MTSLKNYVDNFLKSHKPMIQYLRDTDRHRVGVLVAFRYEGDIFVGYSKVNESAGDTFDREYGIARAVDPEKLLPLEQFEEMFFNFPNVPKLTSPSGKKYNQYIDFIARCHTYFLRKPERPPMVNLEKRRAPRVAHEKKPEELPAEKFENDVPVRHRTPTQPTDVFLRPELD